MSWKLLSTSKGCLYSYMEKEQWRLLQISSSQKRAATFEQSFKDKKNRLLCCLELMVHIAL